MSYCNIIKSRSHQISQLALSMLIHKVHCDTPDPPGLFSITHIFFRSVSPIANHNRRRPSFIHNMQCDMENPSELLTEVHIFFGSGLSQIANCNRQSPRLIHKARCDMADLLGVLKATYMFSGPANHKSQSVVGESEVTCDMRRGNERTRR